MTNLIYKLKRFITRYKVLKIGVLLVLIAVLLSIISITNDVGTTTNEGVLEPDDSFYYIEWKESVINSTLDVKFVIDENSTDTKTATLNVTDRDFNNLQTINISDSEKKEIEIDTQARYIFPEFSEGEVQYTHEIVYYYQPYRLLSIPALILTIIGLVFSYKGRQEMFEEKYREEKLRKLYGENKDIKEK